MQERNTGLFTQNQIIAMLAKYLIMVPNSPTILLSKSIWCTLINYCDPSSSGISNT